MTENNEAFTSKHEMTLNYGANYNKMWRTASEPTEVQHNVKLV